MTSLTSYQLLQSKSKKNKLSCEECERSHDNGHLYCIKFYKKNNDNIICYKSEYTVGCTHADWDGENWCDSCYTIADNKVLCHWCGHLDWGRPKGPFGSRKYLWVDGSTSCFNDLK